MPVGVENAFCFVFLMSVNNIWPRAGVVQPFRDVVGGIAADVGDRDYWVDSLLFRCKL